ncbi:FAD-binding protein, partial [Deinococcus pimensis]|uniref:FAD-binding protein n=1 Tax=Deinococcus pimensis TaxID=309888 RepID=UPI000488C3FE
MFTNHERTDLLVLGGGVAGAYACLRARALGLRVTVACKTALEGGSTLWAQGGAAAPIDLHDVEAHVHDTLA